MLAVLSCPVFTSCYDDSALNERLDQVQNDVNQLKSDLAALKAAVEKKLTVVDYNQIDGGYELLLSDGSKINIYNGADGQDGKDGQDGAPGQNGQDGAPGQNGQDGAPGQNGQDGQDGKDGADGKDGDAFFQSVELSEDGAYLIITLVDGTVYELPMGGNFNILFTLSDAKVVAGETVEVPYTVVGAAEADEVVVRVLSASNCQAAVVPAKNVVTITPEFGEGYVDIYALNNTTGELKAKTISFNGEEYFAVAETVYYVSPVGGDVEIPVTTSADYELTIDDSWLAYSETKAIREETVVLTAAQANTASKDLMTNVTMTSNATGKVLATFLVVQKNYYPELIADEAGEQVEWAETFTLSRYEDVTLDSSAKKGVFTFELTDNPAKGAYKVVNMFKSDMYWDANGQMVSGQGGTYYADVDGDVLTVYYKDAVLSYGFSSDIQLTYDAVAKTFSVAKVKTYNYANSREAYIYDYVAGVKVDAPAGGAISLDKFAGTWTETFKEEMSMGYPQEWTNDNLKVSVVDGQLYFENMFSVNMWGTAYAVNCHGTLSEDGTTITIEDGTHMFFGPTSGIVLNVEGNTITCNSAFWGYLTDYVAVNPNMDLGGGDEPEQPAWPDATKNWVEGESELMVSQLVDGGVYRIHKTSTSYVWYNDPAQSNKLTTPKTDGNNEGRLVVFTKKADVDAANGAAEQFVCTFTDLYTKKALTYNEAENRLYFNGEAEDAQWFTITDDANTAGRVYMFFYGTSDYLATTGTDAYKYEKSQAFKITEMVAE